MISVRTLTLTALYVIFSISASSQKMNSPTPTPFQAGMKEVIGDYPNRFRNLAGEVIQENPQTIEYQSRVTLSGAEFASVTEYSSTSKAMLTWQARMLTTEDFAEAAAVYEKLFHQLKGIKVEFPQYLPLTLKGEYEAPREEIGFASIIFTGHSETRGDQWDKLKVELSLQYEFPEWKIRVLVYEKEREDDERGEIHDY